MSWWKVVWCLIWHWHKHGVWENSRKCRRCGLYFRNGASNQAKRARRTNVVNIWNYRRHG